MQYLKSFFSNNLLFNCTTLLITLISIILTIYFYLKSTKKRKPQYSIRTISLIRENIQKIPIVDILYEGNKIDNLSISKFIFWNNGKETINGQDIAPKNPLRIKIEDEYKILGIEIIFQKNTSNDFKVNLSDDKSYFDLSFEYVDFEEGVVIQIYHTGKYSNNFSMAGAIKSVKDITRIPSFGVNTSLQIGKKIILNTQRLATVCFVIGSFFCFSYFYPNLTFSNKTSPKVNEYAQLIMGIVYISISIYYISRKRLPKGFDIFRKEFK